MRRLFTVLLALGAGMTSLVMASSPQLTYNDKAVAWNTEFSRTMLGYVNKDAVLKEISGIACSRVTPGYIWMQSDNYSKNIVATDEAGTTRKMLITFTNKIRNDWEDMCGGVYNGKNYLFIGAFGDNNASKGNYKIIFFEEPALTKSSLTIAPDSICFQYPDGKHNAEAMMYDNQEQMIYIISKVYYDVCKVYRLPMSLNYGSQLQTLEYVCDLGRKSDIGIGKVKQEDGTEIEKAYKGFQLVTGADISPDGNYVLIKNHNNTAADQDEEYSWTLLWKRQGNESLSATLKRQPEAIACYEQEWQGEAICWLNDSVFYTVSDDDGQPPMYKYVRTMQQGGNGNGNGENPDPDPNTNTEKDITINGNFDDWSDLNGLAHSTATSSTNNLYDMRWYGDEQKYYFYLEYSAAAAHIDIFLSIDDDPTTGYDAWFWNNSGADYLFEKGTVTNGLTDATFSVFDNDSAQDAWGGLKETSLSGCIYSCVPVVLANGHIAVEGEIDITKLPNTIIKPRVGVFSSDEPDWNDNGNLPESGSMLEIPIHRVTTSVSNVQSDKVQCTKVLRNGQLFIIRDGKAYTVQGQLVR